ncbi:hypothetical protein [Reyranella sp.]|uniref:hypothetical protein n=1 Tax=Reyranella sp. TaxID=1929291 RepID=UPI001219802B|nr:hypothetical protein [Reyranella sp.]TAJ85390.1 MAG: hypothetical protein EPO50_16585 [Reyranella sp.]
MAFHWHIDSKAKLILGSAAGVLTSSDLLNYLKTIAGVNALEYRQLLDLSQAIPEITLTEAVEIGVRIRMLRGDVVAGPAAIVMPKEQAEPLARMLGIMAMAHHPLRLFKDLELAKKWIDGFATQQSANAPG